MSFLLPFLLPLLLLTIRASVSLTNKQETVALRSDKFLGSVLEESHFKELMKQLGGRVKVLLTAHCS